MGGNAITVNRKGLVKMIRIAALAIFGTSFLMMSNAVERAALESLSLGHLNLSEYLWASNAFYLLGLFTLVASAVLLIPRLVK